VEVKLRLDENISPKVGEMLRDQDGLDAVHVRERGLLQAADRDVLERAYAEDRVLVTKNVEDFVKLARARDLHPGSSFSKTGTSSGTGSCGSFELRSRSSVPSAIL
jgi:predicted nuclease of predicted toxin-antitoxin system